MEPRQIGTHSEVPPLSYWNGAIAAGFLLIASVAAAQRTAEDERNDWPNLQRYMKANAELSAPAPDEDRVVFMGNSIFDMWASHFATTFPGKPYIGRGIGGQTTPQMLVRFRQDVIALKPKVVVILAGTERCDCGARHGTFDTGGGGRKQSCIDGGRLARASGIRVVMASVLYQVAVLSLAAECGASGANDRCTQQVDEGLRQQGWNYASTIIPAMAAMRGWG